MLAVTCGSGHGSCAAVQIIHRVIGEQIDALLITKDFSLANNQVFDTPPGIGNIIRDTSGAVRNVFGFLKDRYLHVRHFAFGLAGGTHAGRIAADDDKFHAENLPSPLY